MLKIDRISKNFYDNNSFFLNTKKFKAVKNVSVEIEEGDILGIIGESGSGKSTLAKVIAGIHNPSKGDISYRGKSLLNLQKQRNIYSVCFSRPNHSLNPRNNIAEFISSYNLPFEVKKDIYTRIKNILNPNLY